MRRIKGVIIVLIILISGFIWFGKKHTSELEKAFVSCHSISNGTTIAASDRLFINLPGDIYPYNNWKFTKNGVSVGSLIQGSNLKTDDEAFNNYHCISEYMAFTGNGTVDLLATSSNPRYPDYKLHFTVDW